MRRIAGNAVPRSIIMILTAVAVLACFSMAAAAPMRAAGLMAEWQGGLSGKAYYFFPVQTGDPAQFTNSEDDRFSHLRSEPLRFFALWGGVDGLKDTFFISQFRIDSKNGITSLKETIDLKLRI